MMSLRYVPVDEPRLWTAGRIAEHLGVAVHRVQYIVSSRRIRPAARAARLRLFDRDAVDRIADELHAIDARRPRNGEGVDHVG